MIKWKMKQNKKNKQNNIHLWKELLIKANNLWERSPLTLKATGKSKRISKISKEQILKQDYNWRNKKNNLLKIYQAVASNNLSNCLKVSSVKKTSGIYSICCVYLS